MWLANHFQPVIVHDGFKPVHHYLYMFPPTPPFDPDQVGTPAFLTPLLKQGRLEEARDRALVKGLEGQGRWTDMVSYAGFLTVNPAFDSNLYFWFFPSQSRPDKDPFILWLQVTTYYYKSTTVKLQCITR